MKNLLFVAIMVLILSISACSQSHPSLFIQSILSPFHGISAHFFRFLRRYSVA